MEEKEQKKAIHRKRKRQQQPSQDNSENDNKANSNNEESNDSKPASTSKLKEQQQQQQFANIDAFTTRRISGTEENDADEKEIRTPMALSKNAVKRQGKFEDPNHTIDKGFLWEWETHETKKTNHKNNHSRLKRPLPENFGKCQPRSWGEARAMMMEFYKANNNTGEQCEVPPDHPLLGKFVTELRKEHTIYRRHQRKKDNFQREAYRKYDRDSLRDLTRIERKRISQLTKIGFDWKRNLTNSSAKQQPMDETSSNSGTFNRPFEVEKEKTSVSSLEDDYQSNDLVDTDSDNEHSHASRNRKISSQKSSVSVASSSSSSSSTVPEFPASDDDDDNVSIKSHKEDHANDDEMLIVSSLDDISLQAKIWSNRALSNAKQPTMPIHLYRLLRLSALQPKLGLNKLIRWTDDGLSFVITDEAKFMKEIVEKISNMKQFSSFRSILVAFSFRMVQVKFGKNRANRRTYQHTSIREAQAAKDPSLRLFYRGAPIENLRKILTIHEEAEDMKREREGIICAEYDRILAENLKNFDPSIPTSKMIHSHRFAERMSRMTSDGCLLPRGGSKHLLGKDGIYERPRGAHPKGLEWDKFRGLWTPPHLVNKGMNTIARTEDEPLSAKRRKAHLDQADILDKEQDSDDESSTGSKDEKVTLNGKKIFDRYASRRTSEGFLMPKSEPLAFEDGTYKQPKGQTPKNMEWDSYRGLWVPEKKRKKRKFASDSSSISSLGEDAMIIKASKAKLFHHSSTFLRTYLSPKKKKQRHGNSGYNSLSFQARTKSNPSGIVNHAINLNNWRKIEKLMQRARKERDTMEPSLENERDTNGDEGAVLV